MRSYECHISACQVVIGNSGSSAACCRRQINYRVARTVSSSINRPSSRNRPFINQSDLQFYLNIKRARIRSNYYAPSPARSGVLIYVIIIVSIDRVFHVNYGPRKDNDRTHRKKMSNNHANNRVLSRRRAAVSHISWTGDAAILNYANGTSYYSHTPVRSALLHATGWNSPRSSQSDSSDKTRVLASRRCPTKTKKGPPT